MNRSAVGAKRRIFCQIGRCLKAASLLLNVFPQAEDRCICRHLLYIKMISSTWLGLQFIVNRVELVQGGISPRCRYLSHVDRPLACAPWPSTPGFSVQLSTGATAAFIASPTITSNSFCVVFQESRWRSLLRLRLPLRLPGRWRIEGTRLLIVIQVECENHYDCGQRISSRAVSPARASGGRPRLIALSLP